LNWKSFAKAIVPAVIGVALAAADMIASGHFDIVRLRAVAAGIVTALIVYFVPNAGPVPVPAVVTATVDAAVAAAVPAVVAAAVPAVVAAIPAVVAAAPIVAQVPPVVTPGG